MGSVDTSLHPHTSGLAATVALSHTKPHPLKLWAGWFCPFVQRTWIVLQEKGIDYQYHEVNPYKKEAEFLEVNPRGLVPTLECPRLDERGNHLEGERGKPLIESSVICEYLDDVYNDTKKYGRSLLPEDAFERARCRIWIDFVGSRIIPSFYRLLQHQPDKPYSIEEARMELLGHLKTFIKNMDNEGSWFLGLRFSMVDISIAPWVLRLFLIDHYKPGGLGLPNKGDGGEDEELWQRWRKFAAAVRDKQSIKETLSEPEQYIDAYQRYAEDKTQSQVGQATRSGKGLP